MTEKILILILPTLFLAAFISRNQLVKAKIKQRVRAPDPLLFFTVILSILCIFMTIASTYSELWYGFMGPIFYLRAPLVSYIGLTLFGISFISGWFISAQLKESWRVGVEKSQRTELIQDGIYAFIRNPYFLTYFIGFFSLFLVRPSIVMAALVISTTAALHGMVIKEEIHLSAIHGSTYEKYKKTTGRYLPRCSKGSRSY